MLNNSFFICQYQQNILHTKTFYKQLYCIYNSFSIQRQIYNNKPNNLNTNTRLRNKMLGTGQQQPIYKKIDNYVFKFDDMLGQGNFSKVYRGVNQITKQNVAIKVIELNSLKSKKLQQLLFSEIDVLKKLNHPNILKCYEVFTSNRNCYIITEVCNGGDLETKLKKQKFFSESQAEPYILDVFKGLKYLAENHVIHRDLKVANIFLHNGIAKVADFGFAKFTKDNFKDINIGSPIYMSPQGFIQNIYGPKTDVWAFGIYMYELLHGKTPFSHCLNQSDLRRQIRTPLTYSSMKSELSFDVKDIITKCLQINEQKRVTIAQLQQTPYFQRLLKYDAKPLGGSTRKNNLLSTPSAPSNQFKSMTPNHFNINPTMGYRNGTDSIGNSLQKNKFGGGSTKNFYSTFQAQGSYPRYNAIDLRQPPNLSSNNKTVINNLSPNLLSGKNNYSSSNSNQRLNSSQKLQGMYQNSSPNITHNNNTISRDLTPHITPFSIHNSHNLHHLMPGRQIQSQVINKPRVESMYNNTNNANTNINVGVKPMSVQAHTNSIALPGLLNFKQAVNALHYCRLIYKYIMMSRQVEQKDRKFSTVLSAIMFKILNQITIKIQKKQIAYNEQTTRKQAKLKQVSSQYYRKYSSDIQRPFNRQVSYDNVIAQVKTKVIEYEHVYLNNNGSIIYLQLLHFLTVILEATQLLKKCAMDLKYWEWNQYRFIEEFLSRSKQNMTYQTYVELKDRNNNKY